MISYTPPRRTAAAVTISGLCFAIAAAAFLASRLGAPYGAVLQLICVAGLVAGIQITSRFVLTEYTYRITTADGDSMSGEALAAMTEDELAALPALTVVKRQGKSYRTMCNISLRTAVTLTQRAPLAEMERKYGTISKIFNFSANMFTKNVSAADSGVKVYAYICDFNGSFAALYLECGDEFADALRNVIKPFTEQGEK